MAHTDAIWIENHSGTTFWMQMSWCPAVKRMFSFPTKNVRTFSQKRRKVQCLFYSFIGFFIKSWRPNPCLAVWPLTVKLKKKSLMPSPQPKQVQNIKLFSYFLLHLFHTPIRFAVKYLQLFLLHFLGSYCTLEHSCNNQKVDRDRSLGQKSMQKNFFWEYIYLLFSFLEALEDDRTIWYRGQFGTGQFGTAV